MDSLALVRTPDPGQGEIVNDVLTIKGFEYIFNNVVSVVLALSAIVLFIMLILGGLKYLTSGGDPKATESAQKTLTSAIGGIVLVILAFFILRFIQEFTGVPVTEFKIFQP